MIDIHCHILPGVDDGVQSVSEALELIRMESSGGTHTFVASSHVIEKVDFDRLARFAEKLEEVREAVSREGMEIALHPGGEIYPSAKMLQALDEGKPVTVGNKGTHILVDLPMGPLPHDFDSLLFEVKVRGITPIIAHPERNAQLQANPQTIAELVEKGMLLQVNAPSLYGKYGPKAQEVAFQIIGRRQASFLASDSHRASRKPVMGSAVNILEERIDAAYIRLLTKDSAAAILAGEPVPARPMAPEEKKGGFLRNMFGRR
jgi:protein-tyrosine phosphatase